MPRLSFWFDYASTYSHLAALRIGPAAEAAGVEVAWRPFLLGPIFGAQGWRDSPFNLYPVKGRNMWRDMDRQAAKHGLPPIRRPEPFPQNSLRAARLTLALPEPLRAPFAESVFRAEFAEGLPIDRVETLAPLLHRLGRDPEADFAAAESPEIKTALRAVGEEAAALGLYGAPSFVAEDGELFWGHDRLEDALAWATGAHPRPA